MSFSSQPSLFQATQRQLLDDAEGGVWYRERFVDASTAARWFHELREQAAWQAQRRTMYEREVDVPRLVASYRLAAANVPPALVEAGQLLCDALHEPFNAVGLNYYRDGNDSVAMHHDKLHMLVPGHPIGLLSLGCARTMTIRSIATPRTTLRIELEPGSLLVMSHASQLHFEHGIPKTRRPVGERISLAYRVRPPDRHGH